MDLVENDCLCLRETACVHIGARLEKLPYGIGNHVRVNVAEARVVAFEAFFVAEDGAWAAVHVELYDFAALRLYAGEAYQWLGGAPD